MDDGSSPPCRAGGAALSRSRSPNDAREKPARNAGSVERRGEDSIPRKGRADSRGSEAAVGEGAAKMASASSGPAAAGFSPLEPGVPAGTSGEPAGWGRL